MRLFVGVRWGGASNESVHVVVKNDDIRSSLTIFSERSHAKPQLLYWKIWSLSGFAMTSTLNGHFALKSVFGSAAMGWCVLAFRQNCSEICRAKKK